MNDVARRISETQDIPTPSVQRQRHRHRSRLEAILIVLACLAALAGVGGYLSHRNARQGAPGGANQTRPSATVAFAVVKRADIPLQLQALGTVVPIAVATVRPQVSGVLSEIFYREGQMVRRGDALAQIDPRSFQLALDQAKGQLLRDQAELANARILLERNRTLLAQDSIAKQDVDTQAATVAQLEAAIAADRAAVGAAQLNLSYSKVTAPIDGRVGLRPVDVGNYVSTGDANGVATITQIEPIDVSFALPSDEVVPIQQRVAMGASLTTTVLDRTRSNVLAQGTFLTLDNQIDTQTGTIRAKARFDNDKGPLFPNQFVNVQVQLNTLRNALVVPAAAIRHGPKGEFVYVVAKDATAHVRWIKTGPATDELTSVLSGLTAGERVVTEGGDRLTDGSRVRLPGQHAGTSNARTAHGAEPHAYNSGTQATQRAGQYAVNFGARAAQGTGPLADSLVAQAAVYAGPRNSDSGARDAQDARQYAGNSGAQAAQSAMEHAGNFSARAQGVGPRTGGHTTHYAAHANQEAMSQAASISASGPCEGVQAPCSGVRVQRAQSSRGPPEAFASAVFAG